MPGDRVTCGLATHDYILLRTDLTDHVLTTTTQALATIPTLPTPAVCGMIPGHLQSTDHSKSPLTLRPPEQVQLPSMTIKEASCSTCSACKASYRYKGHPRSSSMGDDQQRRSQGTFNPSVLNVDIICLGFAWGHIEWGNYTPHRRTSRKAQCQHSRYKSRLSCHTLQSAWQT